MKNLKQTINILLLCIVIILSGCSQETSKTISLCDYKSISVDKEYTEINQEEIETIIFMDFSSNDFYEPIEKEYVELEDTVLLNIECSNVLYCCENYYYEVGSEDISREFDDCLIGKYPKDTFRADINVDNKTYTLNVEIQGVYVLKDSTDESAIMEFYGYSSIEETMDYLRKRAFDEIVFNYMWEIIKEKSKVFEFPAEIEEKIYKQIDGFAQKANEEGKSLDLYLSELGVTLDDLKLELYSYYYELVLAEEILFLEKIQITEKDKNKCAIDLAEKNNISLEELGEYFSDEDIYYQVVMAKLKEILVSYIIIE